MIHIGSERKKKFGSLEKKSLLGMYAPKGEQERDRK
jgi:hypothetical protein